MSAFEEWWEGYVKDEFRTGPTAVVARAAWDEAWKMQQKKIDEGDMMAKVLDTYRCLISCRKTMPGMKLEDALSGEALASMEGEYEWLKNEEPKT